MVETKSFINFLIITMIITGAANTLVYKMQNLQVVGHEDGNKDIKFQHPFMQATTMFFGEALCFLLFLGVRRGTDYKAQQMEAAAKGLKIKVNYLWLMIPAFSDLIGTTLQYIALNYISSSIYQMVRGGVVVITAAFSVIFLKKKMLLFQYVGCGLVILGISIVGLSSFPPFAAKPDEKAVSQSAQIFAIALIIISLFTNGIMFVSEEKILSVYSMHPFQIVGAEGLWGLCGYVVLLPLLTFIPCPEGLESCIDGKKHFERPDLYFEQIGQSPLLVVLVILGIITIASFNIAGVSVTKYVSATARSVVDVMRTILIWAVGLIVTLTVPGQTWENTKLSGIAIELIGFAVLVAGNFIYSRVLIIPFLETKSVVTDAQVSLKDSTVDLDDD